MAPPIPTSVFLIDIRGMTCEFFEESLTAANNYVCGNIIHSLEMQCICEMHIDLSSRIILKNNTNA